MSEVKFGPGEAPATVITPEVVPAVPAAATQAVVVAAPTAVSAVTPGALLGDFVPEFKDIQLPNMNIVQNIGELAKTMTPGQVVFDQRVVLFSPVQLDQNNQIKDKGTSQCTITILGFKPVRYAEKVAGGGQGLLLNTEDDVRKNGGTLDYSEAQLKKAAGIKYFERLATALVAIERPEHLPDDGSTFTWDVAGVKYALAFWNMKGSAYTAAAKKVFFTSRFQGCLKAGGGYPSWSYSLSTMNKPFDGGHSAWVPICIQKAKSTDAFMTFAKDVLGAK